MKLILISANVTNSVIIWGQNNPIFGDNLKHYLFIYYVIREIYTMKNLM